MTRRLRLGCLFAAVVGISAGMSGQDRGGASRLPSTAAGDWPYYCAIHSFPGGTAMNGVVHVTAPAPAPTPALSGKLLLILIVALALLGAIALRFQ